MKFDEKTAGRIVSGVKTRETRPARQYRFRGLEFPVGPVRVAILDQFASTLGEVTEEDARREGFRLRRGFTALGQFREHWEARYGAWSDGLGVWVVRFEVDREGRDEFLADVRSGHGDYTASPARAVDDLPVAPSVPQLHTDQRRAREELDRRMLTTEEQVRREVERARRLGTDIHRESAALERTLESVRRKNDRRAA